MKFSRAILLAAVVGVVSLSFGRLVCAQTSVQNNTQFDPVEAYSHLTPEQKANLAARIPQLHQLAAERIVQAAAAEAQLREPNTECAEATTRGDCLRQKIELYKEVGEAPPQELLAQLEMPTMLRQDAEKITAVAQATGDLQTGHFATSFKTQGSYLWQTFRDSWKFLIRKDALFAIGMGAVGYGIAKPFQPQTDAYFNSHKLGGATYSIGYELGLGYTLFVPAWVLGEVAQNDKVVRLADDWVVGTLVGGALVEAGKYGFHEYRPDHSDRVGLPSGHAEETSMMCTLTGLELGWKWGVPACMVAGFVDWTRIQSAKHSPGQVALGIGIGVADALAVFHAGNEHFDDTIKVGQTRVHYIVSPMYVVQTGSSGMAWDLSW